MKSVVAPALVAILTAAAMAIGVAGCASASESEDSAAQASELAPASSAGPTEAVRAIVVLAPHDSAGLDATIAAVYDPSSPSFRKYLSQSDLLTQHAPTQADVSTVTAWLKSHSLTVTHVATDRLLLEVQGQAGAFASAFGTSLSHATSGLETFSFDTEPKIPAAIASIVTAVVAPDSPAAAGGPPTDTGTTSTKQPSNPSSSFLASQIAGAYGASSLYASGIKGANVTIGIVGTGGGRTSDLRSFWQAQGITRNDITFVTVTDPATKWNDEATLDLEWSGAMAPAANLVFYGAADNHDGSMLFAMNEAIGRGQVDIVSDSFSHHESIVPADVRTTYDVLGRFAAASGVTLFAASGDTSSVDFPAASPWWTSVGGTTLTLASNGSIASEEAWQYSGCGLSALEPAPAWQSPAVYLSHGKRAIADISLHADSYFYYFNGKWSVAGGTSFASPTTAGLFALVDSARHAAGKPRVGYLNPLLYSTAAVHSALHDVTSGASGVHSARAGWDYPTGWGSTNAAALATAIP